MVRRSCTSFPFFFFNDTATTEIYTLSLHDALPISDAWNRYGGPMERPHSARDVVAAVVYQVIVAIVDRKSTRLNSSHVRISYAVFCLKKKKKQNQHPTPGTSIMRDGQHRP